MGRAPRLPSGLPVLKVVSVPTDAWTTGNYTVEWDDTTTSTYANCASVNVVGVTEHSMISVNDRTNPTDAVRMIPALEAGNGCIKFYADTAPSDAAVFVVEVTG